MKIATIDILVRGGTNFSKLLKRQLRLGSLPCKGPYGGLGSGPFPPPLPQENFMLSDQFWCQIFSLLKLDRVWEGGHQPLELPASYAYRTYTALAV